MVKLEIYYNIKGQGRFWLQSQVQKQVYEHFTTLNFHLHSTDTYNYSNE